MSGNTSEEDAEDRVLVMTPNSTESQVPADLSIGHLYGKAKEAFKRQPILLILVCAVCYGIAGSGGPSIEWVEGASSKGAATGAKFRFKSLEGLGLILGGPLYIGLYSVLLTVYRGKKAEAGEMLAGFAFFVPALILHLLFHLIVAIGMVLLVVPGTMAVLGLSFSYLFLLEDNLSPTEAMRKSWALTNGHKWDLFILLLGSIALLFAGLLFFGVGVLVALPIISLMWAGAYEELRKTPPNELHSYEAIGTT